MPFGIMIKPRNDKQIHNYLRDLKFKLDKAGYCCKVRGKEYCGEGGEPTIQIYYNQKLKHLMEANKLSTPPLIGKYANLFEAVKASHLLMGEEDA